MYTESQIVGNRKEYVGDSPNYIELVQLARQLDRDTQALLPVNNNFDWSVKNFAELVSKFAMLSIVFGIVPGFEGLARGLAIGCRYFNIFPEKKKS